MPYGTCARCGWRYELCAMRPDWTHLRVCRRCHDEQPMDPSPRMTGIEGRRLEAPPEGAAIEAIFDDAIFDWVVFDTGSGVAESDL